MRRLIVWCLVLAGCGGESGSTAREVDTHAQINVQAGNTIAVACLGVDSEGRAYVLPEDVEFVVRAIPEDAVENGANGLVARTAGTLYIYCGVDADHLDPTPAEIWVLPGQPASVTTVLDTTSITAGEDVTATCTVADRYGNLVTDATPALRTAPRATGNVTTETVTVFSRAGTYTVGCHLDGVESDARDVTVAPALPAAVRAATTPVETTFAVGAPVTFSPRAYDRYGNEVTDAEIVVTATIETGSGPIVETAPGTFEFGSDGVYRLTATVASPTDGDIPLVASHDVVVSGNGPPIRCVTPPHASHVVAEVGAVVSFEGATDLPGLASLTVDGTTVVVAGDGTFSANLTTRFGVNTVHVVATDGGGNTVDRTCAFVASPATASETAVLPHTATLSLRQGALYNVATDAGFEAPFFAGLFETLGAATTLLPDAKPRVGSTRIANIQMSGTGPMATYFNAAPMDGTALGVDVTAEDFELQMRVRGEQDGVEFDLPASIDFGGFDLRVVLDLVVDATGRLRALPRAESVTISFHGDRQAEFVEDPDVLAVLQRLADGTVETLVREGIRNWLTGRLAAAVDAIIGRLDVTDTGEPRAVARIDGGTIALAYATAADPALLDSEHGVFQVGTSVTAEAAHARAFPVPLVETPTAADPAFVQNAVAAVHAALFGQVLHALWRAGFYDATADGTFLETTGASITTSTALPPAVSISAGGRLIVDLGAIDARVFLPGVFDDLPVSLSLRGGAFLDAAGGDLVTGGFTIDELRYATGAMSLDASSRQTLELLLRRWATGVLDAGFEGAIGRPPAPDLAGRGVTQPSVDADAPHLLFHGVFDALE
jgi:hypothetical protein